MISSGILVLMDSEFDVLSFSTLRLGYQFSQILEIPSISVKSRLINDGMWLLRGKSKKSHKCVHNVGYR
jgi:hypothetical protein